MRVRITEKELQRVSSLLDEISSKMAQLRGDRPRFGARYLGPSGLAALEADQQAWDAANPDKLAKADALREELEALEAEKERVRQADEVERLKWAGLDALEPVPRLRLRIEQSWEGPDDASAALKRTPAFVAAEAFDRDSRWCLLMLGKPGSGKSLAAGTSAVTAAVAAGYDNRWISDGARSRRLPAWVRASESSRLSGYGDEAEARLAYWRSTCLLVLDDLGTEMLNPLWQQALDDVLDERYQHGRKTIITSNLVAADFKTRYGERITDRIREDGTIVTLTNDSLRQRPTP